MKTWAGCHDLSFLNVEFEAKFWLSSTVSSHLGTQLPSLIPDIINSPLPPCTQSSSHCFWTFCSESRVQVTGRWYHIRSSLPLFHIELSTCCWPSPIYPTLCPHTSSHVSLPFLPIFVLLVSRAPATGPWPLLQFSSSLSTEIQTQGCWPSLKSSNLLSHIFLWELHVCLLTLYCNVSIYLKPVVCALLYNLPVHCPDSSSHWSLISSRAHLLLCPHNSSQGSWHPL